MHGFRGGVATVRCIIRASRIRAKIGRQTTHCCQFSGIGCGGLRSGFGGV